MFYYVFFLRPPPTQVSPANAVTFTPQVANDLRTEDFTGEEEIYYSWSLVSPNPSEPYPAITPPQKLTTWRSSNFKEFSVPLPPRVRDGQSYRLVLTTRQHGRSHILNLASRDIGEKPFPVTSMPILVSSRARAGNLEKQQQIERVYRVPLQPNSDGFLTIREQTSFDLDKKVWDSGVGLSSWLVELASFPLAAEEHARITQARQALLSSEERRIIELGSGTGIVSLTLGALRSARTAQKAGCILTTDLGSALPLLQHNIATNASLFTSPPSYPRALELDWDEALPEGVRSAEGGFDAIIMADVTPPGRSPTVILGYKERDPEERTLWEMVKAIGVTFERVGERVGAGREPVEIWIGACTDNCSK
ncbi:putative methyltransferase-domain-containing protein [Cerioporus squamosus]|nr:putative methyltransferase-domain-containing protein [Cerioporus squamosus]